ncbi:hypothetical protein COO91_01967 [Nostoc flagelliforme CCNUN1]|uniref:Uncharacterized protein n=1 Tax=Nostoc flagelliforme CCNUN1 TaxID=2038116 RepID=A0A2K8SKY5_9NOSO|nr:hypothetical protein [Nostoc flagelliforme]AUB36068.1 hypothetical protein COO91_01967 [Nostoc flagelliforme CCNUN1]
MKDKLTIVAKRSFTPAEFIKMQQCIEAEANGNTLFFWVEDCIRLVSVSYYDWLVFASGMQMQVGCVRQNINLGTTTWLTSIEGTQYEFGERIEAVAACLAFGV